MSNSNLDNFTKSEETSQDIHNKVSTSRDLQSTASSLVNQILNCTNQTEKGLLVGKLADLPWDYFENQHPGIFALDLFLYSAMEKIVLVNGAPTGIDVVPNWMSSYVFLVEEELSGYAAQVAKWSLHFYTDDYFTHSATQQYV